MPKKTINHLSNTNNDRYNNIGYSLGITVPLWVAGGFVRGSAISLVLNGGGFAIAKMHEKWTTPPEE